MKPIVSILLFLPLFFNLSIAQDSLRIDSLRQIVETSTTQDTNRVNALTDLAQEYNNRIDFEKMLPLGIEALRLSEELGFDRGIGMSYNAMAAHHVYGKNYDKVVDNSLKALKAFKKAGGDEQENTSLNNLGIAYNSLKDFPKAIDTYNTIWERVKDKRPYSQIHMATLYNLSEAYKGVMDTDNVIRCNELLLEIAEELDSDRGRIAAYSQLANINVPRNINPRLAIEYANKGLEIVDSVQQLNQYYHLVFAIAQANFSLRNYAEAEKDYKRCIHHSKETKNYGGVEIGYQILSRVYLEQELDEKAFSAMKNSSKFSLEGVEDKNRKLIRDLEVQYETDKIREEKVSAEKIAVLNRNLLIASLVSLLMFSIIAFFLFRQQKLKKQAELIQLELKETKAKLELERQLRNSELKALKAQMNPHFLFNAFNSIQEYIILNKKEMASDYLGKFADLMRIYLDHSREKSIVLEDEIRAADLYLELERIRFEEEMEYEINVDENVDEEMTSIPPMLIQPFLENALKHGLFHKKGDKRIQLAFKKDTENALICSIRDNGIGRKASALINQQRLKKHKSFATAATQNRIELLNIGREKAITFTIHDLTDENENPLGTEVILRIPSK